MAPLAKSLALAGSLFAALSAAAPVHKRGNVVVFETETTVVWTTVDITTTIYGPQPTVQAPATTVISVTEATPTEAPAAPVVAVEEPPKETPVPVVQAAPEPETERKIPTTTVAPQPPVQLAPQPTTTAAPTTTSVVAPPPQPTQPAASNGSGSSSSSGGPCSSGSPCKGDVTFYDTATSASAPSSCGFTNDGSSENVIALPVGIMTDSDCGRVVNIKYGGVTKTGKVVDKCMGCDDSSIDLSRHFFSELAAFTEGRLFDVEWWLD
ncbi:hypothetical protein FE257_009495 [Aspergillus nanangensis]|uniref:Allergen Asp f 7 n=1 Tax=Aspergillus nanangensis TaxID=2582783 RepID=A0AAD4CJU3_ASPNN|nr:hypothetical protein FE257_009495 [Aspergillus nanangensis]